VDEGQRKGWRYLIKLLHMIPKLNMLKFRTHTMFRNAASFIFSDLFVRSLSHCSNVTATDRNIHNSTKSIFFHLPLQRIYRKFLVKSSPVLPANFPSGLFNAPPPISLILSRACLSSWLPNQYSVFLVLWRARIAIPSDHPLGSCQSRLW
jgi:hypothetical protein